MTLKKELLSAGRWTTSATIFRLILLYAQTMILARLLTPSDFGNMAIIVAFTTMLGIVADFGISNALIHFPTPSQNTLSSLYWINFTIACLLAASFMLLANPIAKFYQTPELTTPLLLMALLLPIGAIGNQFKILAEKEFRFSRLIRIEILAALIAFAVAIILAFYGYGIYSLVIAAVISSSARSILFLIFLSSHYTPKLTLNFNGIGKLFRYGGYKLGETFANTLNNQTDIFLGGYFSGATNIGAYSVPRDQNMSIANNFVNPIVTRISTPAMAILQQDKPALKDIYLLTLRMTSSINFPIYMFVCLFSSEIVAVLMGSQWKEAEFYMFMFAIWGGVRSVGNPTGSLLYSTGNVRRAFWANVVVLMLTLIVLYVSVIQRGLEGLCFGMLFIQLIIFIPTWRYLVYPICNISLISYITQLLPPFIVASLSCLIVWLLSNRLNFENVFLKLGFAAIIFTPTYILLSIRFNKPWFLTMKTFLNL